MEVLVDTDTLSEISRGKPQVTTRAAHYLQSHAQLTISAITAFERLRGYRLAVGKGASMHSQLAAFEEFLASCRVVPVDRAVASTAAVIWANVSARKRKAIGDLLIASTAITYGFAIATRNHRDFAHLAKAAARPLELVDWTR